MLLPLTAARALTSWQLDVPAVTLVGLLAAAYLGAVWHLSRRGEHWPMARTLAFLGLGLGAILLVSITSIGVYSQVLFWPRAVQYAVLLSLAPLLLALGEPVDLARRCLIETRRQRLDAVLRGRITRVLTFPLVGALLGMGALLVIYLTPLYQTSLTDDAVQNLLELGLLIIGCLFFVPQLSEGILPAWCGYPLRTAFAFLDGLVDALPGVVIMTMKGTIAVGYYRALDRGWGPTPHWDQITGGGLMFTLSEAAALPFLIALFFRLIREDKHRTEQTDRELDRILATDADNPELTTKPWWELIRAPSPIGRFPRPIRASNPQQQAPSDPRR